MFWLKTIKRGVLMLRNRAILFRSLARLSLSNTLIHQDPHNNTLDDDENHIINILTPTLARNKATHILTN
jgi:hypothetical protein